MLKNNNQLPPRTHNSFRAILEETHFGGSDKPVNFLHPHISQSIIRGIIAYREPFDLQVNCETAKLLAGFSNVNYLMEPPSPATTGNNEGF